MITYLVTGRCSNTIDPMLTETSELRTVVRVLPYEELFFERRGPISHVIFSDIDRISRYERETAASFAAALRAAEPAARILNHPGRTLDRVPLLTALNRAGINDFVAERLDVTVRPARYPVFLRTEDGHVGPETDLLHDLAEFDAAVRDLQARGLPLRGRVVIGYAGQPGPDGDFRRYSAFKIGDRLFADELFVGDVWALKDRDAKWSAETAVEELAFVRANPHRDALERAFAIGQIDFGRADYGLVHGKVQVFEINTNPTFTAHTPKDARHARHLLVRQAVIDAFRAIDTPLGTGGRVRFAIPRPRAHAFLRPRKRRLLRSLGRRWLDYLARR